MKSIHPKIHTLRLGKGVHVYTSPGGIPKVVFAVGSVDLGGKVSHKGRVLSGIASMLFDEGTTRHSKKYIQEFLDDRGAKVTFSTDGRHLIFSISCLRKHFPEVLSLTGEMLDQPLFGAKEFENSKKRLAT